MRLVALRRARAAVPWRTEVGLALHRAGRRESLVDVARPCDELRHIWGHVEDQPVPPAAPGWRVRIVDGHGKALRLFRGAFPPQLGRHVAAVAAETFVHMLLADLPL